MARRAEAPGMDTEHGADLTSRRKEDLDVVPGANTS